MALFSSILGKFGIGNAKTPNAKPVGTVATTGSHLTPERVIQFRRGRFNPIAGLTPELLAARLASWRAGYLRDFALLAEEMERRDMVLSGVAPKRRKDVARHGFTVLTADCGDDQERKTRAEDHKTVLEFFYANLSCTHALNEDERGGVRLLFMQMMQAVGLGKAVHEIIWQPKKDGATGRAMLTAHFRFIPLWFFEGTTNRLRFLTSEGSLEGVPMAEGEWMITGGDGIMEASAVGFLFKYLPLKNWLIYCDRFGLPYVAGKTNATKGSAEWNAMKDAVTSFIGDGGAVMNKEELIELVSATSQGEMPQSALVEYVDKHLMALWRGGDLATQSGKSDSVGSNAQVEEGDILVEDDADMIEETLQQQVERFVIQYHFGPDAEPLAWMEIALPQRRNTEIDLKVDAFLLGNGVRLSKAETLARYQRTEAEEEEDAIEAPKPPPTPAPGKVPPNPAKLPNARTPATDADAIDHREAVLLGMADDFAPLRAELERIAALEDPKAATEALEELANGILGDGALPAAAAAVLDESAADTALDDHLVASWSEGVTTAAARRPTSRSTRRKPAK